LGIEAGSMLVWFDTTPVAAVSRQALTNFVLWASR
jgi:hypothetical protein